VARVRDGTPASNKTLHPFEAMMAKTRHPTGKKMLRDRLTSVAPPLGDKPNRTETPAASPDATWPLPRAECQFIAAAGNVRKLHKARLATG
jgi:hypothetical protein